MLKFKEGCYDFDSFIVQKKHFIYSISRNWKVWVNTFITLETSVYEKSKTMIKSCCKSSFTARDSNWTCSHKWSWNEIHKSENTNYENTNSSQKVDKAK